jgi:hypothetical protein
MLAARAMICCLMCALSVLAAADEPPLSAAMKRGLIGKPAARQISAAQWNRDQRAAMDKSEAIMQRALQEPGLLAQYETMRERYAADDNRVFRMMFAQYLSWFQTFVGGYDDARASFSLAQVAQPDDASAPTSAGFHAVLASGAILKLAHERQAVFFNEAHSVPVTRTLTVELLADLRAQGFDWFAAETLSPSAAKNLERGYPSAESGFYINEPIYGEMVRAALRLGYHVVAYDAEDGDSDARERAGAQILYDKVFKHDPAARLVVNAGFSHIQKSGTHLGGKSMAEVFRAISGIDPLSIEQTMMIEHARSADDHPYYRAAMAAAHPQTPFVYATPAGSLWTLKPGRYDVSVFFPPQTSIDGRPDWVSLHGRRQPYALTDADCLQRFPCLIQAHYAAEGDDAVAADRVVFEAASRSRLYLYPGGYRISALDRAGKIISARETSIDATP